MNPTLGDPTPTHLKENLQIMKLVRATSRIRDLN
jgi:hypothetical protein